MAVVDEIELVRVGVVIYNVSLAVVLARPPVLYLCVLGEHHGGLPSCDPFHQTRVAGGAVGVAVRVTAVHEVPPHAHGVAVASVGVVEVGVAQTVGELVADGAYAVVGGLVVGVTAQLVAAGVGVDNGAVHVEALAIVAFREIIHVGPHGLCLAIVGLAVAGIQHEHLVGLVVAVPVILFPVDLVLDSQTGLGNHLAGVLVIVGVIVVLAIIGAVMAERHRAYHVEGEVKLSVALVVEEVVDAAHKLALGIVFLVCELFVERLCVAARKRLVRKLCEDDEALLLAVEAVGELGEGGGCCGACFLDGSHALAHALCERLAAACCQGCSALLGVGAQLAHVGKGVGAVAVGHIAGAVVSTEKMDVLVAAELCAYLCAVCQAQGAVDASLCRHSHNGGCKEGEAKRE